MNILYFGFHKTILGKCLVAWHDQAIYWLSFFDDQPNTQELQETFHTTEILEDNQQAQIIIDEIFSSPTHAYHINMQGTPFQQSVWQALLTIRPGTTKTYAQIAQIIGKPKAIRAVANAIAGNNISYIIPCHRVIRKDDTLGGYRWGIERKQKMIAFEKI